MVLVEGASEQGSKVLDREQVKALEELKSVSAAERRAQREGPLWE